MIKDHINSIKLPTTLFVEQYHIFLLQLPIASKWFHQCTCFSTLRTMTQFLK